MKKVILIVAILAALFSGFWYYSAGKAKQFVAGKFDEAVNYFDGEGYTLKNEGIDVRGFPFSYKAVIKSPTLKKKDQIQNQNDSIESVLVDGDVSLISNLIGSNFSVQNDGKTRIVILNKETREEYILTGDSITSFSVEGTPFLESIKNPFKAYFEVVEGTDKKFLIGKNGSFSGKNLKLFNVKNPAVILVELDKGDIKYAIKENQGEISFVSVNGDLKGLNVDTLIIGSDAYNPGVNRSLKEIATLMSVPKPGKTDISFDFEGTAPFNRFQGFDKIETLNDIPPFNFNLKKFEMTNSFGNYSHKGIVSFKDVKDAKQFHLDFLGTQETSKAQFANFRNQMEEFLNNLPICKENGATQGACPLVKDLIPKMDEFGKIVFDISMNFDAKNSADLSDNSKLVVDQFNYYSSPYGMKSKGFFEFKKPEMVVSTYKIQLLNYQTLFKDLSNYVGRVQKVLPFFIKDGKNIPNITENHFKLITDYLKSISDEPKGDQKDLTITVKINGPNNVTVGTLQRDEFIQKSLGLRQELMKDLKQK